jgi:hypothetical protein
MVTRYQPDQSAADGWELVTLQEHREGGMGTSYWDAACSVATAAAGHVCHAPTRRSRTGIATVQAGVPVSAGDAARLRGNG